MAKHLNVNLAFNADTKQVKSQLQDLQNQLTKIMQISSQKSGSMGITKELQEATQAAASLKAHLNQATNVDTGKLDLGLLNKSFKEAGVTLDQYRQKLQQAGPAGQQAFTSLANSILKAEIPLKQCNTLLNSFATTLKNTARWQISSSILHGFMGSIQTAFYYAKDLNESLNNIRIVTGYNTDQMAKFAQEANKAAQALSTTTTEYTNASLIYYQQGLSDKEVKERTDVTVKMANVTRESAEEVSQQMTAIWNNFDNGSKSLEYYSDVVTALGAATASSSAEIAQGLEKFAAVADTVGLSYEYATSALATVTATTRQSADVVGNAFKTLFARLQSLKLDEKLDDGTDLTKYSKALSDVGIQIKNTDGELKEMDQILDELGSRWNTLSKNQQVALANTVAGVRQYTQLIALMDNWDFFQENLDVAKGSEGTLQKQADIYAESWEAARDRVKAAAEEIYSQLLNDNFFIGLNNGFADFLSLLSNVIKGIGGVQGAIALLGNALTRIFAQDMANGIDKFIYNMQNAEKVAEKMRNEAMNSVARMSADSDLGTVYEHMVQPQQAFIENAEKMSEIERQTALYLLDEHEKRVQNLAILNKQKEEANRLLKIEENRNKIRANQKGLEGNFKDQYNDLKNINTFATKLQSTLKKVFAIDSSAPDRIQQISELFKDLSIEGLNVSEEFKNAFNTIVTGSGDVNNALITVENAMNSFGQSTGLDEQALTALKQTMEQMYGSAEAAEGPFQRLVAAINNATDAEQEFTEEEREMEGETNRLSQALGNTKNQVMSTGEMVVSFAQALSSVAMALSMLKGLKDIWTNEDLSTGEKLLSTLTTLGMVIPMLITSYQALNVSQLTVNASSLAATILNSGLIASLFGVKAAEDAATTGALTFEAAISPLIILVGALVIGLVALVGVVMAVKAAFDAIHAASPEGQLEAAKNQAEELASALEEAKKEAEELVNAFDNYKSAVSTLEECTTGTEEWRDALAKVNEEVINILNNFPELAKIDGLIHRDNSGQLRIDEELMQQEIESIGKMVQNAEVANLVGQQNVREKEIDVKVDRFKNEAFLTKPYYSKEGGEVNQYTILEEVAKRADELIDLTDEEFITAVNKIGEDLGLTFSDLGENLIDFKEDLNLLGKETLATQTSMKNLNLVAASKELTDKGYSDTVIQMAANSFDELVDEARQGLDDEGWGTKDISVISDGTDAKVQEVFEEYARAIGLQGAKATDIYNWDKNREFVYEDKNGEEQTVSLETMKTAVATARALEALGQSAEDAKTVLVNIAQNTEEKTADVLNKWISSGDLSQMTEEEEINLNKNIVQSGGAENFFKKAFGVDNLDEVAELFGKDTGEEVIDAFYEARDRYSDELRKIKKNMSDSTREVFEGLDDSDQFTKLSLEGKKSIGNILKKSFAEGGKEGLSNVSDILSKLKPEEVKLFGETLEGIDWDDTSVDELSESLEDAGISTDDFRDNLVSLVEVMSSGDALSFDQLAERYKEISDIVTDMQTGDTISAEDYVKLGGAANNYFTRMMDGTYKLTGDAKEFYDVVQSQQINKFKENNSKLESQKNLLTDMKGYDFEGLMRSSVSAHHVQDASGKETLSNITYDTTSVQQQIDIIRELGDQSVDTKEKVAEWQTLLNDNKNISVDSLQEIADKVAECGNEWENLDNKIQGIQAQMLQTDIAIASSYDNLEDLRDALEHNVISAEAFNTAAVNLDRIKDLENLDPEELENFADYIQDIADSSADLADGMSDAASKIVAKGIMKMNDGIETLSSNWEEWSSILQDSTASAEEYAEAMGGTKEAMANLLDISKDFIDTEFIKDNMEDIKLAAEGDADAIDRLKAALVDPIVAKIAIDNNINEADLMDDVNDLQSKLDAMGSISVGTEVDDTGFIDACNEMIKASGMTTDQVNALFDAMGFEANFSEETQPVDSMQTVYTKKHTVENYKPLDGGGAEWDEKEEIVDVQQVPIKGEAAAFAFSTNGEVPKINSITKKASGSSNNSSSSNPGGKKGGGKKGGGGGKGKEPEKKDPITDKPDPYYDIKNAIAEVNQELERNKQLQEKLNAYQQHYAGKTLIKSLQKENELLKEKRDILDKQYENYQKLYEIQSQELAELKGTIGGTWDGDVLQNYAELYQANIDRYNAAIEAYNMMTQELQETIGKQMIEDAKQAYDAYKQALERYQTLYYNEMYDTQNKLAEIKQQQLENQLKIIENNLKAWEVEVELKLDTTRLKREWDEFIHDVEKDFRKVFEDLSLDDALDLDKFKTYEEDVETKIKQIEDVEKEIEKMEAAKDEDGVVQLDDDMMFGSISEAQEYLKKLQSELVEAGNNLNELYKNVWDNYLKGLDQASKRFEQINKKVEHLSNELEFEKELIELVYGDKAYDLMDKYYKTQQKGIESQIASTRKQTEFWEDQFNKAYEMNKDKHKVDLDDMSTWTEDMKKAYDEMIESQEKLNDLVIEGIKNLKDEYLNNVAKTLDKMDKDVWGMSFDDLKEDWDFIQKKASEYLDDVEGAYKIQTLANKIDQSIAETTDLKAQEKLTKLREEEISMLREKENLTQDDIDLAEARYQIALKEIALQDAQNTKTSMKLTRDTSGNWTYQYVADEDNIKSKQQELLDAYNNLYETADNAYNHAMELAMDTYEEYRDKLQRIAEDTTITEEEKYQKMQELQEMYLPLIEAAFGNTQIYEQETMIATAGTFAQVCTDDQKAYESLTTEQKNLVDSVKNKNLTDYGTLRQSIIDGFYPDLKSKAYEVFKSTNDNSHTATAGIIKDWDKNNKNSVKGGMKDAFDSIIIYTENFEKELKKLEKISGKNITDPGGVINDIEDIGKEMEETVDETEEAVDKMDDLLDELRKYVEEVEAAWEKVIDKIKEAIASLEEYLKKTEEAASVGPTTPGATPGSPGTPGTPGTPSNPSNPSEPGTPGSNEEGRYEIQTDPYGVYNTWGVWDKKEHNWKEISGNKEYLKKKWGLETGGYTGTWDDLGNSPGRLAFLHQKELVLNAKDTENMLSTVNAIRDITKLNDSIDQTIANSIGRLVAKAITTNTETNINNGTSNTNNTFNISAEFPNANDVQTIRDAILSLPNLASQYIHQR